MRRTPPHGRIVLSTSLSFRLSWRGAYTVPCIYGVQSRYLPTYCSPEGACDAAACDDCNVRDILLGHFMYSGALCMYTGAGCVDFLIRPQQRSKGGGQQTHGASLVKRVRLKSRTLNHYLHSLHQESRRSSRRWISRSVAVNAYISISMTMSEPAISHECSPTNRGGARSNPWAALCREVGGVPATYRGCV